MGDDAPRRPRGGQLKDPENRKGATITFRLRERVKYNIILSAQRNGRTIGDEISERLERTLEQDRDDRIKISFQDALNVLANSIGGSHTLALLLKLGHLISVTEILYGGKSWTDHEATRAQVKKALVDLIPFHLEQPPEGLTRVDVERYEQLWKLLTDEGKRKLPLNTKEGTGQEDYVRRAWLQLAVSLASQTNTGDLSDVDTDTDSKNSE